MALQKPQTYDACYHGQELGTDQCPPCRAFRTEQVEARLAGAIAAAHEAGQTVLKERAKLVQVEVDLRATLGKEKEGLEKRLAEQTTWATDLEREVKTLRTLLKQSRSEATEYITALQVMEKELAQTQDYLARAEAWRERVMTATGFLP